MVFAVVAQGAFVVQRGRTCRSMPLGSRIRWAERMRSGSMRSIISTNALGFPSPLTPEETIERHPEVWNRHSPGALFEPPGSEARSEVSARMLRKLHEVGLAHADTKALLVVSHGGALRSFSAATMGHDGAPVPNAAVFIMSHDSERFGAAALREDE